MKRILEKREEFTQTIRQRRLKFEEEMEDLRLTEQNLEDCLREDGLLNWDQSRLKSIGIDISLLDKDLDVNTINPNHHELDIEGDLRLFEATVH